MYTRATTVLQRHGSGLRLVHTRAWTSIPVHQCQYTRATLRLPSSACLQATTAALAQVLSQSTDPKMRNSKFLQFVSKMSKGELMFEDNKVRLRRRGWKRLPCSCAADRSSNVVGATPPCAVPLWACLLATHALVHEDWRGLLQSCACMLQVVERSPAAVNWANEFGQQQQPQQSAAPASWAAEFAGRPQVRHT